MSNVNSSKPSKKSSNKGFKLILPRICRGTDVATTNLVAVPSPESRSQRRRVEELREVFRHFDGDRDGKISSEELRAFFASIGEDMLPEEADAVILDLDSDGDQLLDFGDFMVLMEREGAEDEDLRRAFEAFEVEKGSGRITPKSLQRVLNRFGDEKSVDECKAMIRPYDRDGDGELNFHDFHKMMC